MIVAAPAADKGSASASPEEMPDITGLPLATARRVLRSHHLSQTVTATKRKAAGTSGIVLDQTPAAGDPATGTLTVTVSEPAKTPSLVGLSTQQARDAVEKLGGAVQLERAFAPGKPEGSVISSSPTHGSELPQVLTVTVADSGEGLALAQLDKLDGSCTTTDSATLNGSKVGPSVSCRPGTGPDAEPADANWAIGRRAPYLEFTAGIEDSGATGAGTIVISGDGRKLKSVPVKYGQTAHLLVKTTNVLRLQISVTTSNREDADSPTIVLGDARLLGTRANLALLAGNQ